MCPYKITKEILEDNAPLWKWKAVRSQSGPRVYHYIGTRDDRRVRIYPAGTVGGAYPDCALMRWWADDGVIEVPYLIWLTNNRRGDEFEYFWDIKRKLQRNQYKYQKAVKAINNGRISAKRRQDLIALAEEHAEYADRLFRAIEECGIFERPRRPSIY